MRNLSSSQQMERFDVIMIYRAISLNSPWETAQKCSESKLAGLYVHPILSEHELTVT
jgi:hypothetical protein